LQGGTPSDILLYVKVPIVDRDTCSGQMKRRILDGEICAGIPAGGKDACQVQFFCIAATLPQSRVIAVDFSWSLKALSQYCEKWLLDLSCLSARMEQLGYYSIFRKSI